MSRMRSPVRAVASCLLLSALIIGLTACGQPAVQETMSAEPSGVSAVTAAQVQQWMDAGEPLAILDSRSGGSWNSGTNKAAGALRVPANDVGPHLAEIPRDQRIIVYCT